VRFFGLTRTTFPSSPERCPLRFEALREADRIVLLCHGTGLSNASQILTDRVRQAEVNPSAITEAEILAYARQALTGTTTRPA
jgi:hypothetical protein